MPRARAHLRYLRFQLSVMTGETLTCSPSFLSDQHFQMPPLLWCYFKLLIPSLHQRSLIPFCHFHPKSSQGGQLQPQTIVSSCVRVIMRRPWQGAVRSAIADTEQALLLPTASFPSRLAPHSCLCHVNMSQPHLQGLKWLDQGRHMSPGTGNTGVGFGHGAEIETNVDEGFNQTVTENQGWADKPKMLALPSLHF